MYLKATIEVLLDVADATEGADAMSEAMRPMLRDFAGPESCVIDWRYHSSNVLPVWDTGEGFEYADPAKVAINVKLPPLDKIKTGGMTAYWIGESQDDLVEWRAAVAAGQTEAGFQKWLAEQPPKLTLYTKLKTAERTLVWLAQQFKDRHAETNEKHTKQDSDEVDFVLETVREVIADDSRRHLAEIMAFANYQSEKMNDTANDGRNAVPPTGDDWNALYTAIVV